MSRHSDLSDAALRFLDLIAKAASAVIIPQLSQAAIELEQTVTSASGEHLEHLLDDVLFRVFSRQPIYKFAVRKTIVVNIGPFLKPGSLEATTTFISMNKCLVPFRLIQLSEAAVVKEADKMFADELTRIVQKDVAHDMTSGDPVVRNTFVREQKLHRARYGLSSEETCCIFKLMEEDYELPEHVGKTELACFQFKCTTCGSRHELRVLR